MDADSRDRIVLGYALAGVRQWLWGTQEGDAARDRVTAEIDQQRLDHRDLLGPGLTAMELWAWMEGLEQKLMGALQADRALLAA